MSGYTHLDLIRDALDALEAEPLPTDFQARHEEFLMAFDLWPRLYRYSQRLKPDSDTEPDRLFHQAPGTRLFARMTDGDEELIEVEDVTPWYTERGNPEVELRESENERYTNERVR